MLSIGGPRETTPTWSSPRDFNGDGVVDGRDLGILLGERTSFH